MEKTRVKFYIDGALYAETESLIGEKPQKPEAEPFKDGFKIMWINSDKPTEENMKCFGAWVKGDPELLLWSLKNPLLGYSTDSKENKSGIISASNSILCMLVEIRQNNLAVLRDRVVLHLKNMVSPLNDAAPAFDLSCNWPYCPLTAAITLAHETADVWNELTAEVREKLDFIMECFAYVLALGTNDVNNYRTGPGLTGNFCKTWNPNFRLANVPPMIFAGRYFGGAEKVDELLLKFDYDKTMERFKQYGFNRAYKRWSSAVAVVDGVPTRTQRDFMENGGEAFINTTNERLHYVPGTSGGSGIGVRAKYTYQDATLDEYARIVESLLLHNFSGGEVISTYGEYPDGTPKAYIADHTKSPVEGRLGMMKELASGDGGNGKSGRDIRSCTGYCTHDFLLVSAMLLCMKELGMYDIAAPENAELFELTWVGMTDYLYKREHGYMSYALGHEKGIKYESEDYGYFIMKSWWQNNYGK